MKPLSASTGPGRFPPAVGAALLALLVAHGTAWGAAPGAADPEHAIAVGGLAALPASGLEALVTEQRKLVAANPKDETVRRNLGWISMEAANRILQAESLGRMQEASAYAVMIRNSLPDTLWRVTQLARQDPARGLAALGLFHAEGILAPKESRRGCDEFARAAALGHAGAAYRASVCLAKTEPARARRWLEQSAGAGHAGAQETIARACIETVNADLACAKKWLESAAAQGRLSAMTLLAWVYAREGTPSALTRAVSLYRAAAESGDLAAQNNLGEFHETGRGVPRDTSLALQWYRSSAERGFGPAQFNLARLLAFGLGTDRDTVQAREWAIKAHARGIAQADDLLKLLSDAEKSH